MKEKKDVCDKFAPQLRYALNKYRTEIENGPRQELETGKYYAWKPQLMFLKA